LADDVEVLLQGEKPVETIAKNRVVVRKSNPNFGLGRRP